jgi:hypothetical protein
VATTAASRPAPTFSGGGSNEYCGLANTYTGAMSRFFEPGSTGDIRALYQGAAAAARDAVKVAPPEIKADVQVVADTMTALVDALERVNYEIPRLPQSVIARLMAPDFADASGRLSAYARDVCGLPG